MSLLDLFRQTDNVIKKELAKLNKKFCSDLSYARVTVGIEDLKAIPIGEKGNYSAREDFYRLLLKTWYAYVLDGHSKAVSKGLIEPLGADMAIAVFEVFSDALTAYLVAKKILKDKKKYGGMKSDLAALYEEAMKKYNKQKKKKATESEKAEEKQNKQLEKENEKQEKETEKEKKSEKGGLSEKSKNAEKGGKTRENLAIDDKEMTSQGKEEKQKTSPKKEDSPKEKGKENAQKTPIQVEEEQKKKEVEVPHVVPNLNPYGVKSEAELNAIRENEHYEYLRFLQRYHPDMLGAFSGFVPTEGFRKDVGDILSKNEGDPKGRDKDLEEYYRRQQREMQHGVVGGENGKGKAPNNPKEQKQQDQKQKEQKPQKEPNAPKREKIDAGLPKEKSEPKEKPEPPKSQNKQKAKVPLFADVDTPKAPAKSEAPKSEPRYKDLENDVLAKKINETFKEQAPLMPDFDDDPKPPAREPSAPSLKK